MSAIVCGFCPRCGFDPGEVLILKDGRGRTYGYRAFCPRCDARTVTASSFDFVKRLFARGAFIKVPTEVRK